MIEAQIFISKIVSRFPSNRDVGSVSMWYLCSLRIDSSVACPDEGYELIYPLPHYRLFLNSRHEPGTLSNTLALHASTDEDPV